jgi:hypothetical protein
MLTLTKNLDKDHRVKASMAGYTAWDPENPKVFLRASSGGRKTGRAAIYYLFGVFENTKKIEAYSDLEAIQIALAMISPEPE